jgi:GTP-binding protein
MVLDSGRALVIALNKADLVDADRRAEVEDEVLRDLARVAWAQRINISAQTGRGVHRLAPAMARALDSWDRRIPTGRLNSWLGELIAATPPPVRGGKQPRVLFATQAANRPPTFVLFTTGFLEAGYRRFIERRLREDFDFTGSPVRVNVRVREKRGAKKK